MVELNGDTALLRELTAPPRENAVSLLSSPRSHAEISYAKQEDYSQNEKARRDEWFTG